MSRNYVNPAKDGSNKVTSREGRVSRNNDIHVLLLPVAVTSREGRVSRN